MGRKGPGDSLVTTSSPEDLPAIYAPGREDAAASPPAQAAAAPGAVFPPGDGTWGNHRADDGGHRSPSSAHEPAPGTTPFPGAGRGPVEPPQVPVSPAALAPCGSGSQGTPPAGARVPAGREAAPGTRPRPGAARTSPADQRGEAGVRGGESGSGATSAAGPVPASSSAPVLRGPVADAGRGPGGTSSAGSPAAPEPGRAARGTAAALPAPGLSGEAFRKAWRAAESGQAKDRRNGRSRWPVKRLGDKYGVGRNRVMPPPGSGGGAS